jgi:predicted DNA-binding protein
MDTDKWKSVLVPIEVYKEIKELSQAEGRTISGQLRIIFEAYKREKENA